MDANLLFEALKELGFDEDSLRKFFLFDIEQQKITEAINENTKERNVVLNENIFSFRTILITITGFSLTIIGVLLSVAFNDTSVIRSSFFLYTGIVCFSSNVLISILFILNIYHFENNKMSQLIKFNDGLLNKFNKLIQDHIHDKDYKTYLEAKLKLKEEEGKRETELRNSKPRFGVYFGKENRRDFTPHFAIGFFLAGFILVFLSFIKF